MILKNLLIMRSFHVISTGTSILENFQKTSKNENYKRVFDDYKMASMLVCMIIGSQQYYAKKDYSKFGTEKEEIQDIVMLPVLEIRKPKNEHLIVLSILDKAVEECVNEN